MLNVATVLKTAVLVAFLLRHSIEESRIRAPFNGTLRNGALISAVGDGGQGGGGGAGVHVPHFSGKWFL